MDRSPDRWRSTVVGLARRFALPVVVPAELHVDPLPRSLRPYVTAICLAGASLLALLSQDPGWHLAEVPTGLPLLVGFVVYVLTSESAHGRAASFWVDSSGLVPFSVIAVFGLHAELIVGAVVGALLAYTRLLSISGGWWGVALNSGQYMLTMTVAASTYVLVGPHVPWVVSVLMIGVTSAVVEAVMFAPYIKAVRSDLREAYVDVMMTFAKFDSVMIVFSLLTASAMVLHPYLATLLCMTPALLLYLSTRSEEALTVAEHRLKIDPATGLANRREFWTVAERVVKRSVATGRTSAVVMIDIDNFKNLNDTHGHLEGDAALAATATVLDNVMRKTDLAARYGGEEFGVVIDSAELEDVCHIAERVRVACAGALEPWDTTVSLGVALFDKAIDHNARDLVRRADNALYVAKSSGKNRYVVDDAATAAEDTPAAA